MQQLLSIGDKNFTAYEHLSMICSRCEFTIQTKVKTFSDGWLTTIIVFDGKTPIACSTKWSKLTSPKGPLVNAALDILFNMGVYDLDEEPIGKLFD